MAMHHTTFINTLIKEGKFSISGTTYKERIPITTQLFGRANQVYQAPRDLIQKLDAELVEMRNVSLKGFVVGRGAQMFKEPEKAIKTSILKELNRH